MARSGVLDLDLLPDKLRSIREQVSHGGGTVLLLGVRRDESAMRSGNISRHAENAVGRLTQDSAPGATQNQLSSFPPPLPGR